MKLFAHRRCPFSRRTRIALSEHGVEFEYVELAPDAQHPAELRGKVAGDTGVPVLLVRDDFALWDSSAIVYWIDSAYPRSLYPSQREPQALARAWEGWAAKLYPLLEERATNEILEKLRSIEGMVSDDWMIDGEFTIADAAFAPIIGVLSSKDIASLPPRMRAYAGRLRARPSVREVCELDLPDEQRPSYAA